MPSAECPLCRAPADPWRRKRRFEIYLCSGCRNAFIRDEDVPDDLEDIYSKDYFEGNEHTGYPDYLADRPIIERNFADRVEWIERLGAPGPRLLEVGSAYGLFLCAARDRGWDVHGVELAADCVDASRRDGLDVVRGDFNAAELEGPFDVIAMFDVIEHLRDPVACLARARELLTPGGFIVIETGDHATPWARLLGNHWYFLDPPQHLFYFSRTGLSEVFSQAGFSSDLRVRRMGRRVSLKNICFKLAAAAPSGAARRAFENASMRGIGGHLYLNFGDGMLVAASPG